MNRTKEAEFLWSLDISSRWSQHFLDRIVLPWNCSPISKWRDGIIIWCFRAATEISLFPRKACRNCRQIFFKGIISLVFVYSFDGVILLVLLCLRVLLFYGFAQNYDSLLFDNGVCPFLWTFAAFLGFLVEKCSFESHIWKLGFVPHRSSDMLLWKKWSLAL